MTARTGVPVRADGEDAGAGQPGCGSPTGSARLEAARPTPAKVTLVEAQSSPACYLREASQVKA